MMTLTGYVEGIEISFTFYPPNYFKAVIPKKLNGKYTVELRVADEAGNQSAQTGIHVVIDFNKLDYKVIQNAFNSAVQQANYCDQNLMEHFNRTSLSSKYSYLELKTNYSYRELVVM